MFVATPSEHRRRQLYQDVLAGERRDQHQITGRRQQSERERLRDGQPDDDHHLHLDRDQRDWPDQANVTVNVGHGADPVVHRQSGNSTAAGDPGGPLLDDAERHSVVLIGGELGPQTLPSTAASR